MGNVNAHYLPILGLRFRFSSRNISSRIASLFFGHEYCLRELKQSVSTLSSEIASTPTTMS